MSFDLVDGLDDGMILESTILHEDWRDKYIIRSLTKEESSKLKVSKSELSCSVMYVTDKKGKPKGYIAYTHRAGTGFYDKPEDIPAKKLRFVSSTS